MRLFVAIVTINLRKNIEFKIIYLKNIAYGVASYTHQTKVLKYPLNENFLSLQVVFLRSQLIFSFWGVKKFLS